jgi:predicted nuclease of predicted toxin-antitoxin system
MRLLLDMGAALQTAISLRGQGLDVVHIRELGMQRASDEDIAKLAAAENRVLVTFDLDFSRILALQRMAKPSVVLYRLERYTTEGITGSILKLMRDHSQSLEAGAIVIVEPDRTRIRLLPIG